MAVQASQYPSNIILLNRAAADQEGKIPLAHNYPLQPQPGGGGRGVGGRGGSFLDQPNISFNHGEVGMNTSRKRGREIAEQPMTNTPLNSAPPLPHQLMDLHSTSQTNALSIGLGLAFRDQQQQQQHHHHPLYILSDDLASHIRQQNGELEQFFLAQGEQLRRTLAEKRQRHYRALLRATEESVARKMMEKEAEVEKAVRRNAELEAKLAQLSLEAQAWQQRAKMQENMAANLQAQLERAIITNGGGGLQERYEWGGSAAVVESGEAEDAESAYIDPERVVEKSGPLCKACGKRVVSVVILPCRHLSLCAECDAVSQACPLCLGLRSSSLEVFLC